MGTKMKPNFVIGVDFGMTATGVAYCQSPWTNVKTFQNWSHLAHEIWNKVPSRLCYSDSTQAVMSWGFHCDLNNPDSNLVEHFKLHLDPEFEDSYNAFSHEQALRYYHDFLSKVHDHVTQYFVNSFPGWREQAVEWVFSVPTTWTNPALMGTLEGTLKSAGFGRDGHNHQVRITLTEAEAAAISAVKHKMDYGDVVAVCDAGGGTTDVNILRVESRKGQAVHLVPLLKVEGNAIGSALIDIRVQQHLVECLKHIQKRLKAPPMEVAEEMMAGQFESFKCGFGTPEYNVRNLPLQVPHLAPGTDVPAAGIVNSRIEISRSMLKSFFDEQVGRMLTLLHSQFTALADREPHMRISYLVLSGGLGSSQYVRDRLRSYFASEAGARLPNAGGMQLILAEFPQLAPVLGLVEDRAQELGQNVTAITERVARISYGLVVNQIYDPRKNPDHMHAHVVKDPRDQKRWAMGQIEWLLKEGERIPREGKGKEFRAKLHGKQRRRPWKAQFVQCREPHHRLPSSFNHEAIRPLCIVEADIRNVRGVEMNKHWWNMGVRHELATLNLQIKPGAADLKFELWNRDRLLSSEHETVTVEWEDAKRAQSPGEGFDDIL